MENKLETEEWEKTLRPELEKQLHTILKMAKLMQPKDDAEFVAVALPNLHTDMFHFIKSLLATTRRESKEEMDRIAQALGATIIKFGSNNEAISYFQNQLPDAPTITNPTED